MSHIPDATASVLQSASGIDSIAITTSPKRSRVTVRMGISVLGVAGIETDSIGNSAGALAI